MTQTNAARLLKAVKQDQALKEKLKAVSNPDAFIKIAKEQGYDFTVEELEHELSKLSEADLAAIVNPGMSPRYHIHPR
ncbi:Nif11-like leader peptide family natural product precursor [Aetokthonos hydrillicola Thurmond2011]|jgi:predicted ribosomally synthesized peptide with nif11-like leader|uniref:Nif11-like leader peptide family natural product n=1 Tax=Aetokthonos hydrillicola Thurmond2011 TaxID=2712845 RepID=A0AAP5M524_9CYAN|nr:Nif11-like leader peptide family natural product precursor [Aetokthonos hydrillicola]MBO3461747.1 Nif11-like leader peptide family natural product precursor [Aetokthonos hydrillicola CCALA 1050]MBW4583872.1 Nif11-like leader peptide family natural product precursor [Aetokthonos hydrillicola CCALA 1050]MDR9895431.1 Nif11-like leader peptide family natural product precursor [Aetokthonos hydrillicola Thurmond2011]